MQGILTNSQHDINILIDEDHAALSAMLGEKKYFFGNQPSTTDACVFGFLQSTLYGKHESSHIVVSLKKHCNLVHFVDSIREEWFADKLAKLGLGQGKAQ